MALQHTRDHDAGGLAAPVRDSLAPGGRSGLAGRQNFIDRVSAAASDGATIAVGSVQVISLDRPSDANGDQRSDDKPLGDVVAKVLLRLLGPDDVHTRCGDGTYLVIFGGLTGAAAERRGREIVASVRQSLGEVTGAREYSVKSIVADVDAGALANESSILAAIEAALSARAAGTTMHAPPVSTASSPDKPVLDGQSTPAGDAVMSASREISGSAPPATYRYRPLWDAKQALIAYLIEPGPGMIPALSTPHGQAPQSFEEIDSASLQFAHNVIEALSVSKRSTAIVCPVHLDTLVSRQSCRLYLNLLKKIPPKLRQLLFLEIIEVDRSATRREIADAALGLSRACRSIHLRLNIRQPVNFDLSKVPFAAVGVELPKAVTNQAEMMRFLEVFASVGQRWNVAMFAHGVHSLSLATNAVCAGYRYLSGDAVSAPLAQIDGSYKFRHADLFSHIGPERNRVMGS